MTARRTTALLLLLSLGALTAPDAARAGEPVPGQAGELTEKVRAEAQRHAEVLAKGPGDLIKARRALLVLGPVVWPVLENAMRLNPREESIPHFHLLKALLAPKTEPDFERLQGRLRRKFLMDDMPGIHRELTEWRLGPPDPTQRGKRLALGVVATMNGPTTVYRSADGSIVLGFGGDGTAKRPDAPEVSLTEGAAGFVAVIAGKALPFERRSGRGGDATVTAPRGFAWAYATDGAPGKAPGGQGGDGSTAQATGGAGQWSRAGDGGKGA